MTNIIFIHGLESSGQGFKGRLFQKQLPGCLTPDFIGSLKERMKKLNSILKEEEQWFMIGSSFGGLMSALYTCQNPDKVVKLILLAPVLATSELDPNKFEPVDVPVVIYHGKNDHVVHLTSSLTRAKKLFRNLTYNVVEDDHMLHATVQAIDWQELVKQ